MKFTIELNPTDEQFNAILAILGADFTPKNEEKNVEEVVEAEEVETKPPAVKEEEAEEAEVEVITAKEVRSLAAAKTKSNKKLGAEIKAHIESLGYEKITAIKDQDHLNKVYAFIEAL